MALRYATIEGLRQKCLNDRADSSRDTELTELGEKYEDLVDDALSPYTTVPLTGTSITKGVIELAETGAAGEFHRQVDNTERAKEYRMSWEHNLPLLVGKYRAKPEDRTKAVLVGKDPRDNKIIMPSQASIFAFDDFA